MAEFETRRGIALAAFRDNGQWRLEPLPLAVLDDLGALLRALRAQPPEGGPFVAVCPDLEFFVIARQVGARISLLLSDLSASVDYTLAEQALARLGEDPPEDDELDDAIPIGDLDLFSDLDLGEDELELILLDEEALPDDMLATVLDRIGMTDEFDRAVDLARVP